MPGWNARREAFHVGGWEGFEKHFSSGPLRSEENCQIISQMSLPSCAFFITGQKVPETRERNLSAIIRLMKAKVFSFLVTVRNLSPEPEFTLILENLLPVKPSKI